MAEEYAPNDLGVGHRVANKDSENKEEESKDYSYMGIPQKLMESPIKMSENSPKLIESPYFYDQKLLNDIPVY